GFYDSHIHLLGAGVQLGQVALKDARDEAEFGRRLRAFDRKLPRDRWLQGGEWDHDRTFKGTLPTAELIDRYVSERPVFLRRYQQLARSGRLTLRIDLRWPLSSWRELARLGVEAGHGDDWVKIGGLKGFVDGSLGSSTAKMFEPYVNEPGSTGVFVTPLEN